MSTKKRILTDPFEPLARPAEELPRTSRQILKSASPTADEYFEKTPKPDVTKDERVSGAAKDLTNWNPEKIAERILTLAEQLSGIKNFRFYKYQKEFALRVILSVLKNDAAELTVLISRQAGKTQTVCLIVVALMLILPTLAQLFPEQLGLYSSGFWVGVFAPRDWQVQTNVDRISAVLNAPITQDVMKDPDLGITIVKRLTLSNGSHLLAHTASPQTYIESKTLHIVIVEECQDMDRTVLHKSIHPMLASTAGTMVKIGTANAKKCEFLEAIRRNKRRDAGARSGWKNRRHFEYDYKICQEYNPRYKRFIEEQKSLIGEESDAFRMSYGLEWILERGMFTSPTDLDQLEDRSREAVVAMGGDLRPMLDQYVVLAGLDIGKSHDSTVLTLGLSYPETGNAEGFHRVDVIGWFEFLGDDHESQFSQILPLLEEFRVNILAIDSTGMGDVHTDRYKSVLARTVVLPVVFSTPTKSQLFKMLDREMRAKRVSIPAGPNTRKMRTYKHFRQQMEDLEKEYRNSYLDCHAPKDDRNAHDDYPASFALLINAAYAGTMPMIDQVSATITSSGGGSNWIMKG